MIRNDSPIYGLPFNGADITDDAIYGSLAPDTDSSAF
jgi:hypothetical protein